MPPWEPQKRGSPEGRQTRGKSGTCCLRHCRGHRGNTPVSLSPSQRPLAAAPSEAAATGAGEAPVGPRGPAASRAGRGGGGGASGRGEPEPASQASPASWTNTDHAM